jgi:hypothetical protein
LTRAHNTGQNLNTGISLFLINETGISVLIPVFQKQIFFSRNFDEIMYNDVRKKQVITGIHVLNRTSIAVVNILIKNY